jgi:hypothetical protein
MPRDAGQREGITPKKPLGTTLGVTDFVTNQFGGGSVVGKASIRLVTSREPLPTGPIFGDLYGFPTVKCSFFDAHLNGATGFAVDVTDVSPKDWLIVIFV